eukprot:GHVP01011623.1.p1 GENE.GHVP01011623.1~~GHVP01011623.1.p1  ORF type:complete len:559 (+),score=130.14 GHVP01011623.1:75-1679(+)
MNPRSDQEAAAALLGPHLAVTTPSNDEDMDLTEEESGRIKLLGAGIDMREEDDDICDGVVRYHCDPCGKDISTAIRVRCATCLDFDLCVDCFTSGNESKDHKKDHPYIPVGRHAFPLFNKSWTADEELALLEGVSRVGLGNWNEVADTVNAHSAGPPKKREIIEAHFYQYYFNPDVCEANIRLLKQKAVEGSIDLASFEGTESLLEHPDLKPKPESELEPLGPDFNLKEESTEQGSKKDQSALTQKKESSHGVASSQRQQAIPSSASSVVGHMPLRGDFDVEYDNDAELVLADMEFHDNETPYEFELKLQIIEIFNSRLDERILRKRTILEKGLLDIKKIQQQEKKKSKEERDIVALLRPLSRFALNSQLERLVPLIMDEKRLRHRLKLLAEWNTAGLKTPEEVETYEENKRKAEPTIEATGGSKRGKSNRWKIEGGASSFPGARLLDKKELDFCDKIQLPPVYYLMVKFIMLKEESKSGCMLDKDSLSQLVRLDAVKINSLYEFVLESVDAAKAVETLQGKKVQEPSGGDEEM